MCYRVVLINIETGERQMVWNAFRSKKAAVEFAEKWTKATPKAGADVYRSDDLRKSAVIYSARKRKRIRL